jgi:hypothetical protein
VSTLKKELVLPSIAFCGMPPRSELICIGAFPAATFKTAKKTVPSHYSSETQYSALSYRQGIENWSPLAGNASENFSAACGEVNFSQYTVQKRYSTDRNGILLTKTNKKYREGTLLIKINKKYTERTLPKKIQGKGHPMTCLCRHTGDAEA